MAFLRGLNAGLELDVGDRARGGAGLEVGIVGVEAEHARPDAVGECPHEGVVVAEGLVVMATGYADAVLSARKLILKAEELLVGLLLRVVFREHQQAAKG